jgi:hypothetical protein
MPKSQSMASGDLLITLSRVGSFRAGRHGAFTMRKLLTLLIALGAPPMSKLSRLALALVSLFWLTGATWLPLFAPASTCSQATTFLARTSGLSGTESTAYTNMICGMVADGTWSKFDALYIFATNTTTTANLNLVSTSYGITNVSTTPTFTADVGYTTSGGTVQLNTNYNPNTNGVQFTLNSASLGVYIQTNDTGSASRDDIGAM